MLEPLDLWPHEVLHLVDLDATLEHRLVAGALALQMEICPLVLRNQAAAHLGRVFRNSVRFSVS